MYKNFLNSENIQKNLVDALRKGQTVLPAIECYNLIEEHLLVITHIEKAGKVLLDFIKNPKKFTFCRYPLLLCCLVAEFMQKVKRRFPVYESFFDIIYNGFVNAGYLFASKIKDNQILEYHLQRRDIKNRTCLQIMSQNRIYQIFHAHNIGGVIGKYWGGSNVQYGLLEMTSFTYCLRYDLFDEMSKFEDFADKYNNDKQFYFNYYSYRDIVSIRYYFKEFYNYVLVVFYMILIYHAVIDKDLENTINGTYSILTNFTCWGSLLLVLNKINSTIFFTYVNRWYIEIDSLLGEIYFFSAIIFHFSDLKKWFISSDDYMNIQMADALLLSVQICYLWWRVIDSLKSTKSYGGFLRTVFEVMKKLFLLVVFIYCFVLAFTGIFNLLFNQYNQFSTYFKSFFFLIQAALQQYSLQASWTPFLNFSLMFFIGVCALILCNLVIAYATRIYDEVDDNIEPEHRGNLIKLYEYLNWDENMGIFKFVHAPLNVIQIPFSLFVLFSDNKKYWNDIFTKVLYSICSSMYFILLIIMNTVRLPYVYFHYLVINPFQYGNPIRKITIWLFLGPVYLIFYFLLDIFKFWTIAFRQQKNNEEYIRDNSAEKILEFRKLFSNLISDISEKVDSEKRLKKFSIIELVSHWLLSMSSRVSTLVPQEENNRMHKRSLILKKYKENSYNTFLSENLRTSHAQIFKNTRNKISIFEHFTSILYFLTKFSDSEGFIDKDLARNIFPKRNYYDDEYFQFLYYFNYKYFKSIISKFTLGNGEIKREMNKLRGVYKDITKTSEKFNKIKHFLINISKKDLTTLNLGISSINSIFAMLDNSLLNAESSEFLRKIMLSTSSQVNKGKVSSTFQKPDADNKIINRLEDLNNKKE
jgi:hypothetical protein